MTHKSSKESRTCDRRSFWNLYGGNGIFRRKERTRELNKILVAEAKDNLDAVVVRAILKNFAAEAVADRVYV